MERQANERTDIPLSAEERTTWEGLVEIGKKLREPILARRQEKYVRNSGRADAVKWAKPDKPVLDRVRRWVILRAAGVSFRAAGEQCGSTWLEVMAAKAGNEAFRCALAAQEEHSRQLMRAKAQSVVEQSQDEGAKVSLAQTQVSMKILASLDREHFGERAAAAEAEGPKAVGGGGFVINLVADAAKAAEAVPDKRPAKALVYTDV